eukprot:10593546-Ditylum_brightwellii.AAC.1
MLLGIVTDTVQGMVTGAVQGKALGTVLGMVLCTLWGISQVWFCVFVLVWPWAHWVTCCWHCNGYNVGHSRGTVLGGVATMVLGSYDDMALGI